MTRDKIIDVSFFRIHSLRLQNYLFILLGLSIPTSIWLTNMLIILIFFCWIIQEDWKNKIEIINKNKWLTALLGLIFLYILGLLWGNNDNALWQFQRLSLLLLFPVLISLKISKKSFEKAIFLFLSINFLAGCLQIINDNWPEYFLILKDSHLIPFKDFYSHINNREIAGFIRYNYHNVMLALSYTITLSILFTKKSKYKFLLVCFLLVYSVSIFTERGRAGQIIFIFSSFYYIIYYTYKSIVLKQYFRLFLSFIFVLIFAGFQHIMYFGINNSYITIKNSKIYKYRIKQSIKAFEEKEKNEKENIRLVFLNKSLDAISKKPLFGYGTGSFGSFFQDEVHSGHKFYTHTTPHNQYLYVWFEIGFFGLVLLLSVFYLQIRQLIKFEDKFHTILLPIIFLLLMCVDSYLTIFTGAITYMFLFTIYTRYNNLARQFN